MSNRVELRFSGTGGQGLITAGIIFAEAAINAGKNAVQSQSYGPEARGGASKAEVIISDGEIDYPKVTKADLLLAMSEEAYNKYKGDLKKGGILVMDSSLINKEPDIDAKVYKIPITKLAQEEVGKTIVANIVALGAITAITKLVPKEIIEEAVFNRFPKAKELNKKALNIGFEAVSRCKEC
ncbi:MAG: 2-oxoglutarate ferredoxin oxidoreductase subunit gamma [Thermosediminibacterales bacterium]|nr:2-oxoglutarate ferredoxin oxidoreductase subunit gamma [Thermosediminibacterales bacterium]MDK2836849.1 2-oxoglutarate ferredoxin oxidoreductase subunit gamma [Thermosediminibacterales bacterium]